MTKKNLTDVTLIVDRSGSMSTCRDEAQNGINQFIEDQKEQDGECVFSLVQFDTEYDFVHKGVPIGDVGKFELIPRGMTALLDAVGRSINETKERIDSLAKKKQPALVVFVIVTDGHENSSHEFNKSQIKDLIQQQQDKHKWQFTFLGANQDAFAEGAAMGISGDAVANYAVGASKQAFMAASTNVGRMRTATSKGLSVENSYTATERTGMQKTD